MPDKKVISWKERFKKENHNKLVVTTEREEQGIAGEGAAGGTGILVAVKNIKT